MRGKHVTIVGGGNSAGQAAAHLAKYAATVTLLVRGDSLSTSMSDYLVTELRRTPNVFVKLGVDLVDGEGEEQLETIVIRHRARGKVECIPSDGLFVMIGAEPRTDWLGDAVARDERGYILTGSDLPADGTWPLDRAPMLFETSLPGVFAAGDVRHGSVKRVTTAMGEGRNGDPARPPVSRARVALIPPNQFGPCCEQVASRVVDQEGWGDV